MTSGEQVYVFSQWSTIPDGLDSRAFVGGGIIVSSDSTPETITLFFSIPGGAINLYATRLDSNELQLCLSGGIIAEDLATLSLVYHESNIHPYNQCVYTGLLDFEVSVDGTVHKAIDEMLLVITAHDGFGAERLLCVFWQWTEVHAARKPNAGFTSPSNSPATQLVDGNFTFMLTKDQGEQGPQVLLIEMANTAQETQKFEIVLTSLTTTIRVQNDLELVQCTVQPKLSTLVNSIFTYVGLGLAAVGVPVAIGLGPVAGTAYALGGLVAAMAGTTWSFMTPDAKSYPAMPLGAELDSFVIFGSFDVFVIRITQDGTALAVQSALMADKSGNFSLSSITSDDWKDIIRLDLLVATASTLSVRGFLSLKGLSAIPSGYAVTDLNADDNRGIYTYPKVGQSRTALYHGLIQTQDEVEINLFRKDPNSFVAVRYGSVGNSSLGYTIAQLPAAGQFALLLYSYAITECSISDLDEIAADGVSRMLSAINGDAQKRQAYFGTTSDNKLMAVKSTASSWTVQYKYPKDITKIVFLRVTESPVISTIV